MTRVISIKIFILGITVFSFQLASAQIRVNDPEQFKAALTEVNAGDTIVWKNGRYTDLKIDFSPVRNGSPGHTIVLKAETAGKVLLSGRSQILIGGDYLQVEGFLFEGNCTLENDEHVITFRSKKDASYCRVTNCAVVNYSLTEESGKTNYYMNVVGRYNEVDHCYFKGKLNKGPVLVVEYKMDKGYQPGSDIAPSTHHRMHHNYFGYRTFSSNGGEQMRIGTSTSSFSHGFNIIEYNYFEEERIEAEIISNKSWNNIYRFNTFYGNDGGLVIRHGQQCFVYGNYMNGQSGRMESAGLRVINPDNTFFNNYLENLEGGEKGLKSPVSVMSGLEGSALNEYYPADNAIVAYNTIVNSIGPAIKIGVGNASKGKPFTAPKNVVLVGNRIIQAVGKNTEPVVIENLASVFTLRDNLYTNGHSVLEGVKQVELKDVYTSSGYMYVNNVVDNEVIDSINKRLAVHHIKLTADEITRFNPRWRLTKSEVGVSWIKE